MYVHRVHHHLDEEQSAVLRAGAHHGHVLPVHVVRGAALAHRVHPRLDEDLLPVLRDPQRLVQSVHMERHLLAAAPQQPLPRLALAVGLEVRGRLSAVLSVTDTVYNLDLGKIYFSYLVFSQLQFFSARFRLFLSVGFDNFYRFRFDPFFRINLI